MIIDGRKISEEILQELQQKLSKLNFQPRFIDIVVGQDAVTDSYVKIKAARAKEIGINFEVKRLDQNISQADLEREVESCSAQKDLSGLIVQLPLPAGLDKQAVLEKINPAIDVDVITSQNLGRFLAGLPLYQPPTASAIMRMLDYIKAQVSGAKVLVIGSGDLVGKPVTFMLVQRMATVIVANSQTTDLKELGLQADIIISATGQAGLVTAEMIKPGAIVIDAGTAESISGHGITGDVVFEEVSAKAQAVSPVPGGVGPMTVAMLLSNVVESAQRKH